MIEKIPVDTEQNVFLSRFTFIGLCDSGQNEWMFRLLYIIRYELCPYVIILAIDIYFLLSSSMYSQ